MHNFEKFKELYIIERKNSEPKIEMTLLIDHEFPFFPVKHFKGTC